MANTIKLKRSAVPGKAPTISDLALGELGLNTFDGRAFLKQDNGTQRIIDLSVIGGMYEIDGGAAVTLFRPATFAVADGGYSNTSFDAGTFVPIEGGASSTYFGGAAVSTLNGGAA